MDGVSKYLISGKSGAGEREMCCSVHVQEGWCWESGMFRRAAPPPDAGRTSWTRSRRESRRLARDRAQTCTREVVVEMDHVKKPPACGGNGTRHTVDIIEDGRDTIPPHLTRIHTTTPTYSHHTTAFFSHTPVPHASDHERHEDTPPTHSPASAQPRTTPGPSPTDRAPARSSPGLPTPPHPLGPHEGARIDTRFEAPHVPRAAPCGNNAR